MKKLHGIYLILIILYLETLLHIHIMGFSFNMGFLRVILFSTGYALLFWTFIRLFKNKWGRFMLTAVVIMITFIIFSLDAYYQIMGDFYSIWMGGDLVLGLTFLGRFFKNLEWFHFLYFIPSIIILFRKKYYIFDGFKYIVEPILIVFGAFISIYGAILLIDTEPLYASEEPFNYSDFDIYEKLPSAYQAVGEFGALTYFRLDIQGSNDPVDIFESDEFIQSLPQHEDNAFTGIFEDQNLIYILAESFSSIAIDPDITPVLYQMFERGWSFENFYAPLYYRNTADTEFMLHTGFYPSRQVSLSMESFMDNTFTQTLPRLFDGYQTYSFHNYTDYYYPRTSFLPETIGYDSYKDALDMGLLDREPQIGEQPWPSDQEMFNASYRDYIEDERFLTYYLTVSGHLSYTEDHPIVQKNLPAVLEILENTNRVIEDEPYLYYLAANLELEYMVQDLLNTLIETGRIEDTVIVLSGDHYPYGLDEESIQYATNTQEALGLEIHNTPFVIYHQDLKSAQFNDVFSTIDVTPTIANMFGFDLDYHAILGRDVMDDTSNTVRFQNGSILNQYFAFDVQKQNEFIVYQDRYTEERMQLIFNQMIYLQEISHTLLENDYLNPLFDLEALIPEE